MKKQIILSVLSLIIIVFQSFGQINPFKQDYLSVDKQLIKLLDGSIQKENGKCASALAAAQKSWNETQLLELSDAICNILQESHRCKIIDNFEIISLLIKSKDYDRIKTYTLNTIQEVQELRSLNRIKQYPLNYLLDAYLIYEEIHLCVHDQMFGLREWFEFEDLILDLKKKLELYKAVEFRYLHFHYSFLEKKRHNDSLQKVLDCFSEFNSSLESGYTKDFELPCDQLGDSLISLMLLYSK